ncbi:S-layer homology domain-containing protein [Paenibacillus lemnae]
MVLISNTAAGQTAAAAPSEASTAPLSNESAALSSIPLPAEPAWGYFVDTYKNNNNDNLSVTSNPAIGVLSGFLDLWEPGATWDTGSKLNEELLNYNIQYVKDLSATRTPEQEERAYYDDRRNQSYGATEGLGPYQDAYRRLSGTYTTITSIPEDAVTKKYDDGNTFGNRAGDINSELGKMVDLIGALRGGYASTNPAKTFYSYMRPYRWSLIEDPGAASIIVPTLEPAKSSTPQTDGGFPSGHTNASYLAALSLAYSVPERYQELLTRASEMGNSRIVAGMHSPFDVMGGRVMATALAAAALNDPENAQLKQEAYDQAHEILLDQPANAEDRFTNYEQNKADYIQRLTYGFPQVNSAAEPMPVPKGAEVLLETRQPYLSAEQRREVLATTGIPSGYPVLDDPEGWGRLNLFAAADGYGALVSDTTITMNGSLGGFHAADRWRNDISGSGSLVKEGSGSLTLAGRNTYSGGTEILGGTLQGESATAFGSGEVVNTGGSVVESVYGKMTIGGDFTQGASGTLELNVSGADDVLEITGAVDLNGTLKVKFSNQFAPAAGTFTLITHAGQRSGQFASVDIEGLPSEYQAHVLYQGNQIALAITPKTNSGNPGSGGSTPTDPPTTPTTPPVTVPAKPTAPPVPQEPVKVNPFLSNIVSQQAVLQAVSSSIAATMNMNTSFSDTASHWGSSAIAAAVKLRIVDGYKDGSFRPNAPVTRAEFTAMTARAFGLAPGTASAAFQDTRSSWAAGYIGVLANKGVITGYPDGSFKPNAPISRAEMVAILSRIMNLGALSTGTAASFTDVSSNYWAANAIQQAASANLVQGVSAAAFAPQNQATRAEAAALMIRALESDSSIKELIAGLK